LLVKRTDFLFGRLYDRFSADAIAKAMYLESLEPYILNDTLTSITPIVMKDFVDHYEQRGALTAVEACIIHLDVASIDIHQVTGFDV
jgi:vacuolar protein sorting-associated protein 8